MLNREKLVSSTISRPAWSHMRVQRGSGVDDVSPGHLVPLGQRGEAGGHRPQRLVGLRIDLVEDQEVAAGLQRPRDRRERGRLQVRRDLVDDQEAGGHVVRARPRPTSRRCGPAPHSDPRDPASRSAAGPGRSSRAPRRSRRSGCRGIAGRSARPPSRRRSRRRARRPPCSSLAARPGNRGSTRSRKMRGSVFSPWATSPHEGLVVILVRLGGPGAEAIRIVPVILAEEHVDAGGTGEVEARLGVPQDLVEMRGQAPAFAVAIEQPERERRAAEHVRRERPGAEPRRELIGGEPGSGPARPTRQARGRSPS